MAGHTAIWLSAALLATTGILVAAQAQEPLPPVVALPEAPDASTPPPPSSTTVTLEQLNQCGEQTKYDTNEALLKAYNPDKLFAQFGGPPGEIASTHEASPADLPRVWSVVNVLMDYFADFHNVDPKSAAEYNHSSTDNHTFVRVERAQIMPTFDMAAPMTVFDANGTALPGPPLPPPTVDAADEDADDEDDGDDEFPDLLGELWWAPPDLCGYLRTAEYSVVGGNFTFTVLRRHCQWQRESREVQCFGPDAAHLGDPAVGFAISGALQASLVG